MNDSVYIVGGGPSLVGFDFNRLDNVDTIVINKSIFSVKNPTFFITMDSSLLDGNKMNKDHFISSFKDVAKFFILSLVKDNIVKDNMFYNTKIKKPLGVLEPFDIIIKSYQYNGIGLTWNDFRTGNNSGYCAMQLALLLGYKHIYLLGIDLISHGEKTHYHEGYVRTAAVHNKVLSTYIGFFKEGVDLINNNTPSAIYSCSAVSPLNEITDYIPIADLKI